MKSKTVVCVYGKNECVETVAKRLLAMYTSNYSESYVYGAVIDLPDAISYRIAGDMSTEEKAKRLVEYMHDRYKGEFFCAIRQRRICGESELKYACEEGEKGALRALWRYIKGKGTELFPVFGNAVLDGTERVYISAETLRINESEKEYIEAIEPNGIFTLASELNENEAVFASMGNSKREYGSDFEALFTSDALDRLLSCGRVECKYVNSSAVGVVRYSVNGLLFQGFLL